MVEGARTAVVIDDDPDVRLMLRVALETSGFIVHEAVNGREGVELVRECGPDLVTLDLMLPDFGGVEACRRIREVTDAYIIMITASSDEADRLVGLATGADDYVTKPFSPREVQARVVAMFRRPRVAAPVETRVPVVPQPRISELQVSVKTEQGVLRHGNLVLDTDARVAWCDDFELPLTKIEFDLLVTMVSNPRRVWRRETLLNIVWGGQWSDYHVVEVHIGNLRRKLADASEEGAQLIKTVRGIGYRMTPTGQQADESPEANDQSEPAEPSEQAEPSGVAEPSGWAETFDPDQPPIHSQAHQKL